MPPKISIIMAVCNGESYLRASIDSILSQTLQEFEFIVIDDGSIDSTWDILSRYATRDRRMVLIRNSLNIGLAKSLNIGLLKSKGNYIARQDHDDISLPHRFQKQSKYLDDHENIVMVSCNMDRIDSCGRTIRKMRPSCRTELVPWFLLFSNFIAGHSQVMFRRKPVVELGGYDETLHSAQDYDLWVRLLEKGQIAILPEVLLKYRWHEKSISQKFSTQQIENAVAVCQSCLSNLLNESIDFSEAYRLWSFWTIEPSYASVFIESGNFLSIHRRLSRIRHEFLKTHARNHPEESKISQLVDMSIGERYLKWTIFLLSIGAFKQATWHSFRYSIRWLKANWINSLSGIAHTQLENMWLKWRTR